MNTNKKSTSWLRPEVIITILSLVVTLVVTIVLGLPPALIAIDELHAKDAPPKIIVKLNYHYEEYVENQPDKEKVSMIWDISATSKKFYVNDSQMIIKLDGENTGIQGGFGFPFLYQTIESGKYMRDGEIYLPWKKRVGVHDVSIDFWMSIKDLDTGKLYNGTMERPIVFTLGSWNSNNEPIRIVFT